MKFPHISLDGGPKFEMVCVEDFDEISPVLNEPLVYQRARVLCSYDAKDNSELNLVANEVSSMSFQRTIASIKYFTIHRLYLLPSVRRRTVTIWMENRDFWKDLFQKLSLKYWTIKRAETNFKKLRNNKSLWWTLSIINYYLMQLKKLYLRLE